MYDCFRRSSDAESAVSSPNQAMAEAMKTCLVSVVSGSLYTIIKLIKSQKGYGNFFITT